MTNFKKEILQELQEKNLTIQDILFVSDGYNFISFSDFLILSDFNYDSGYGGNIINMGLKMVGKDFWFERHEYDGSEWWEFKTIPEKKGVETLINITDEEAEEYYSAKRRREKNDR